MNSRSLDRFSRSSSKAARRLRPGDIIIGETTYSATVFHGTTTVENDRGGRVVLRTLVVYLDKDLLVLAPGVGTRITDVETGRTGEIYEIGGEGLTYHILRAASHPDKSA